MTDLPMVISDFESLAADVLEPGPFSYYASGAGAEVTLRESVSAWERIRFAPKVLSDVGSRDLSITLLGKERANPLIVAPMAFQRLAHSEGEIGLARAAASRNAVYTLSTLATASPEEVAVGATESSRWFQIYVFRDRGITEAIVSSAIEQNYEAMVLTVDLPVFGARESFVRTSYFPSIEVAAPALKAAGLTSYGFGDITAQLDPTLTWKDLEELVSKTGVPVLVKGVLRPDDARRAVDAGAAGVVVSNHGGRQLDTVLPTAEALPAIVEAVGGQVDVIVDGGIRRGTDVLKALALGANAVMVGRPVLWGLTVGGQKGAERVLDLFLSDIDRSLALVGCPNASEISQDILAARN